MKKFLAVQRAAPGRLRVLLTEDPATELSDPYARVSPVHEVHSGATASMPPTGFIVFLFPRSPRTTLHRLTTSRIDDLTVFATFGLAAVVAISAGSASLEKLLDLTAGQLNSAEIWPLVESEVVESDIEIREWGAESAAVLPEGPISFDGLPHEVRTEVEQFNLNLRFFWARAARFCDEYKDLAEWLHQTVDDTVHDILEYATCDTDPAALLDPAQHYGRVSFLVEVNACLTMLNSQAVAVTPPLAHASFPIGEHSLLGIGGAARAAWRLYQHMGDVFAKAQHLDKLHVMNTGAPFDSGIRPYAFDSSSWASSPISVDKQNAAENASPPRRHIVYFSSRWGFHQTLQSVSISWQCINGNAARDWNLLTLSHEFLHSHLREILDEFILVGNDESLSELVSDFNDGEARTFRVATRQFLMQQLRWIDHGLHLIMPEPALPEDGGGAITIFYNRPLTGEEALFLIKERLRFLEEVVVHVMDFIYFYGGDDALYVSSLWHSWALIPNVQPKLEEYILRTLLALACTWPTTDADQAFKDASDRLNAEFTAILDEGNHGLVYHARELLAHESVGESPTSRKNLRTRFLISLPLVQWTKQFIVSDKLHAELTRDDLRGAGEWAYPLNPWEFPDQPIDSPSGFLLDRYRRMVRAYQNDELESDSLWHLLVLI